MAQNEDVNEHRAIWDDWEIICEPCIDPLEEGLEEAILAEDDECEDEGEKPKVLRDPGLPSKRQREEHDVTHIPYRSWCSHCVRGSGRDAQSRQIKGEINQTDVPRLHLDYCFFTEDSKLEDSRTSLTALVMKESECKSVWAYPVMHKGAANEPWVVKQILHDIDTIGLSKERIIMKNDQEPAIKDLRAEVARQRNAATAADESRVGDSNSNATIEVAVQEVENMTRTLRSSLESKIESKIKLDHLLVPWLIRHAAANITRFKVRASGKTAFQLMKGFRGIMPIGEFGECVHFRQPKALEVVGKYEDRWQGGIYLGFDMRSGEYIVGTEEGVFRSGAVRRRPLDERWSRSAIDKIKGDPEDYMRRPPTYTKKESEEGAVAPAPIFTHHEPPEAQTRTFRISKEDVMEYGSTPGCAGCRAVINKSETRNHSKTCRERFEKVLNETDKGKERVQRAAQRMDEAVAKEGERIMNDLKDKKKRIEDPTENMATDAGASSSNRKRQAEEPPDDPNIRKEGDEDIPIIVKDIDADYSPTSPAKSEGEMMDSPTVSYNSDAEEIAEDDAMGSVDSCLHSCGTCQGGFVSKNKLFKHLRRMQHFGSDNGSDREWRPNTDDGSQDRNLKDQEGHDPSSDPNPKPISAIDKEKLSWKYIGTGVYARNIPRGQKIYYDNEERTMHERCQCPSGAGRKHGQGHR